MFNFRFGGQGGSNSTEPTSIETVRRRARHRLIGATLLVLAGVIGFPLLFESQPRPVQADFEIEIPSSKAVHPISGSAAPAAPVASPQGLDPKEEVLASAPSVARVPAAPAPTAPAQPAPPAAPAASVAPSDPAPIAPVPPAAKPAEPPVASAKPAEPKAEKPTEPKAEKPAAKPAEKPVERKPAEPKPAAKADDSARALALLEGRPLPQADKPAIAEPGAAKTRFIVQVGAFVDPALAQQARQKLESSGLSTYTQISSTPDGPRTRVRLGPFATRAEAQKAADKARATGLSASILAL